MRLAITFSCEYARTDPGAYPLTATMLAVADGNIVSCFDNTEPFAFEEERGLGVGETIRYAIVDGLVR
jgi:hypothetical protein